MLCKQAASHAFCVPGVIYESIYKGNNSVLRRGYVKLWDWEVAQLTQYNFPNHHRYVSADLQIQEAFNWWFMFLLKQMGGEGGGIITVSA